MQKLFKWIYMATIVAVMTSCNMFGGGNSVDYIPVKTDSDEKWGMADADGNILFSDEFENEPTCAINGYFTVQEGDGYSVYKAEKSPILVNGLENLKWAGAMSEGIIPIVRKDHIEYVNDKGERQFSLKEVAGSEVTSVAPYFTDGLAIILLDNGKMGAINPKGDVVIQPVYSGLNMFHNGYAVAAKGDASDQKYMVINSKGETVVKLKKGMTPVSSYVEDDILAISNGDHYGFINMKGEVMHAPSKVCGIGSYNSKYYVFTNDEDMKGVMSMNNEVVVRPKYEGVVIRGDKFICYNDKKVSVLKDNGEESGSIRDVMGVIDAKIAFLGFSTDFDLISGDNDAVALYDIDCKKVGRNEYSNMGLSLSIDNIMSSVDFGEEAPVEVVADEPFDYSDMVCHNLLDDSDLVNRTKRELRLMRNTIFARHGRIFVSEDLQEYFSKFSWYYPVREDVSVNELTEIENHNLVLIQRYE